MGYINKILLRSIVIITVFCIGELTAFAQIASPDHIMICIMENHSYSEIVGSSSAPYINSLITGSNAAVFTQSFAIEHPSQPNYLDLFSGSNQGVTDDGLPTSQPFTTD